MKHTANILTFSRIILSVLLFFLLNNNLIFLCIYVVSGFTDLLDGYIARKTNTVSDLGARMDSIADLFLFIVLTAYLFIHIGTALLPYLPLLLIILFLRMINLLIALFKYHIFLILHTLGNKLTGILVFSSPLLLELFQLPILFNIILILSALSSIEEGILHIISANPDPDRKSIFIKPQSN